ncbi:MAG: DNA polymerase Y family protein [Taibaiella sp.]|nr:DNA polymerase Y family protein [Taibaiella sp.]
MGRRFIAIWFRHLTTDRMVRSQPELKDIPFVLSAPEHGRMVIKAANTAAQEKGINVNMLVADCRAIYPTLQVFDNKPGQAEKLLNALAEWCLRYTPVVAVDLPDGLILDVSGCAHLWGGERPYLKDIITKLRGYGYDVRAAIADTIGTAWAISRFGKVSPIVEPCSQMEVLLPLSPAALRLEPATLDRLNKLGLYHIRSFISMPRKALRRRFGQTLLSRLDQALGQEQEVLKPIQPAEPYQERLPTLEPIRTATGIEIALKQLLENLCLRLAKEGKGLRKCVFKCYRIDGNIQQIEIGTSQSSRNVKHLFNLFELKIATIAPALGIEVFTIEAPVVEDISVTQDALWDFTEGGNGTAIAELLDRIASKLGVGTIHRYLPDEHYWPERSMKVAASLAEKPETAWRTNMPRPIHLLPQPELIDVTVPMPDYPPLLFHYKGVLHNVKKADGPERIEQEWWLEQGLYRDYYCIEDEQGARYWLFRLGSYDSGEPKWFIHGFFA